MMPLRYAGGLQPACTRANSGLLRRQQPVIERQTGRALGLGGTAALLGAEYAVIQLLAEARGPDRGGGVI